MTIEYDGPAADAADEAAERDPADALGGPGRGQADAGAAAEEESREIEAELDDVQRELLALNDRHLRLLAEYDNYRKRTERERRELTARSQAELAGALLDAVDDLERVAGVDHEAAAIDSLVEGVRLVERKMMRSLETAGLEPIDAEGERFDPATMEALMTVPTDAPEEDGRVADVFQKGYRFNGQLLRPARVRVKQYEG